jgi:hypothetical protein
MLSWFRKDPLKQLENDYARTLERARDLQRNGDILGYADVTVEADDILKQIQAIEAARESSA